MPAVARRFVATAALAFLAGAAVAQAESEGWTATSGRRQVDLAIPNAPGGRVPPQADASCASAEMVLIPAGSYAPLLRGKDEPERVPVVAFWLDVRPVTNAEYLAFVRANPKWQRSRVSPLFADLGYLGDWAGDLDLGAHALADSPVVRVSWFAARAFAAWTGKRLPTTAEWERAASAGFAGDNGAADPAWRAAVLAWFTVPTPSPLPAVGTGRPNFFGVRDLHGLVWEWVSDFNTALVTGESRADSGLERDLFCGAGSVGARDLTNYPAFMRAGFRSSLRANYAVPNLGFRCAKTLQPVGAPLDGARAAASTAPTNSP